MRPSDEVVRLMTALGTVETVTRGIEIPHCQCTSIEPLAEIAEDLACPLRPEAVECCRIPR
jgi:hypothetical protein